MRVISVKTPRYSALPNTRNPEQTRTPLLPDRANDAPGRIRLLRDRMTQSAVPGSIFVTGCDEPRSFRAIVLTSFYPPPANPSEAHVHRTVVNDHRAFRRFALVRRTSRAGC